MDAILNLLLSTTLKVWQTFLHNWPFLLGSIVFATALTLYVDGRKVSRFLKRNRQAGVLVATAAAVGTPLCSCGTMAVILGMMAGMMPWAPIVAFMVASPLTSPGELIYSAGLFGWPFALAFFGASILLGLAGGAVAGFMDGRGWLAGQARYSTAVKTRKLSTAASSKACDCAAPVSAPAVDCGCNTPAAAQSETCGCSVKSTPILDRGLIPQPTSCCGSTQLSFAAAMPIVAAVDVPSCACSIKATQVEVKTGMRITNGGTSSATNTPREEAQSAPVTLRRFIEEMLTTGIKLLPMFFGFVFIGYFLNGLIPTEWVKSLFGNGNVYSVPLAATLGLPFYINSEASLPLVRALLDSGMSQGAALAFLITGSGTSIGAVAGMLTVARWRVVALVIGTLWVGGIVLGFAYDLLLATGIL